jgi:DNA-binding NtrC family response regulator
MHILVVDDEPTVCSLIREVLETEHHTVKTVHSGGDALALGSREPFDLVLCDVRLGEVDGFTVLQEFRERLQPDAEVVLMTGFASLEAALNAVKLGANDYICKPFSVNDLSRVASEAEERIRLKRQPPPTVHEATAFADRFAIIGRCPAMIDVFKVIGRVAPTDLPVLIAGESGTGKELIARAIHNNSARASKPFVAVNCGALTETLLETELFGHVKGAFTGAATTRRGLFEEAEGGTLLLDEVTETSPGFQVRLLRVLQESEIRRVGSNDSVAVDVRILATTNQDMEKLVTGGTFRKDLMYRLNVVSILLPPLRERGADLEMMIDTFLARYSPPNHPAVRLTPDSRAALLAWHYPGNVRELRHTIQRLVALANGGIIRLEDLPTKFCSTRSNQTAPAETPMPLPRELLNFDIGERPPSFDEVEKRYVEFMIGYTHGNKKRAAELMGIDRKTLGRMVERHGLTERVLES